MFSHSSFSHSVDRGGGISGTKTFAGSWWVSLVPGPMGMSRGVGTYPPDMGPQGGGYSPPSPDMDLMGWVLTPILTHGPSGGWVLTPIPTHGPHGVGTHFSPHMDPQGVGTHPKSFIESLFF